MNNRLIKVLFGAGMLVTLGTVGCAPGTDRASTAKSGVATQQQLVELANGIEVSYQITDNNSQTPCPFDASIPACATATITLDVPATPLADWAIYLSNIRPIFASYHDAVQIDHINGDLHRLSAKHGSLSQGQYVIPIRLASAQAAVTDIMPNWMVMSDGLQAVAIKATKDVVDAATGVSYAAHAQPLLDPSQARRGNDDTLPIADAQWLFEHYQAINQAGAAAADAAIATIPQVAEAKVSDQRVAMPNGLTLAQTGNISSAAKQVLSERGIKFSDSGLPLTIEAQGQGSEAYEINISAQGIEVRAAQQVGASYAMMTLAQLYDPSTKTLPVVRIKDAPAYEYRGMHIDIARNFPGEDALLELVEQMYRHKLNKLHLHLADDEGWRLEIPSIPELTSVGATRCSEWQDGVCLMPQLGSGTGERTPVNGYLSVAEYQALLRYAQERHIEVIPSLDMPGHARAAIKSIEQHNQKLAAGEQPLRVLDPQDKTEYLSIQYYKDNTLNPCVEGTYQFVDKLLDGLQAIHQQAGVELNTFHIGADETAGAWSDSVACAAMLGRSVTDADTHDILGHFVTRVAAMVKARGITVAGWSDGMGTLPSDQRDEQTLATIWTLLASGGTGTTQQWLAGNAKAVLSFPDVLYFDFPYRNHPDEPGYYWASKDTDTFKVFQFTPQALAVHQALWRNPMGQAYEQPLELMPRAVHGIQGQVWSEVIRSRAQLEYMIYPRLFALAERAWHQPAWTATAQQQVANQQLDQAELFAVQAAEWQAFSRALTSYSLPHLAKRKANFRLPPPGIQMSGEQAHVNTHIQGLDLEYSADGNTWQALDAKVTPSAAFIYRTRLPGSQAISQAIGLSPTIFSNRAANRGH